MGKTKQHGKDGEKKARKLFGSHNSSSITASSTQSTTMAAIDGNKEKNRENVRQASKKQHPSSRPPILPTSNQTYALRRFAIKKRREKNDGNDNNNDNDDTGADADDDDNDDAKRKEKCLSYGKSGRQSILSLSLSRLTKKKKIIKENHWQLIKQTKRMNE